MSYRTPSRKSITRLAAAGGWHDDDVVLSGTDGHDLPMRIERVQAAAVPGSLVRRWLLVKDARGGPRLKVVRDFVSGDGCLFTAVEPVARFRQPAAAPTPDVAAP